MTSEPTEPAESYDLIACDWCELNGTPCPGVKAHCEAGQHCTTTEASCAMSAAIDDHPSTCEDCGAELPKPDAG